jgi:hypothetical protein
VFAKEEPLDSGGGHDLPRGDNACLACRQIPQAQGVESVPSQTRKALKGDP